MAERGNRGGIEWRIAWCSCARTLADGSPSVGWSQIQVAAYLVNHDDLAGIKLGLFKRKYGALPGITFRGDQRLFLRDQPIRRSARPNVQALSCVP